MAIEFETKKLIKNGEPCRMFTSFKALNRIYLPEEYLSGYPCVYIESVIHKRFIIEFEDKSVVKINPGSIVSETRFKEIVDTAKKSGKRLHEINKINKEVYPEHFHRLVEKTKI